LSVVSNVRLLLFDILGREVVTLVNELNPVGKYSVTWNGRDNSNNLMPSGVYIYQLFVNGVAVEARKLIVNK
jgi:flagellar hook assembly protein FlgD